MPRTRKSAKQYSEAALRHTSQLMTAPRKRPEDRIRQDLGRLLDALEIDNQLTFQTSAGQADMYLPRRRVFIETKRVGLADDPYKPQSRTNPETPFEQVCRYLKAERDDEALLLPFEDDLPWTGIVTDGQIWHVWEFPDQPRQLPSARPEHTTVVENFRPATPDELLAKIEPILSAEPVGKPRIPQNPVDVFEPALDRLHAIHEKLSGPAIRTTETKLRLWLDMLEGSGMAPSDTGARTRLFTTHCFLVTLARGVIHTLHSPDQDPDPKTLLKDGYLSWILDTEDGRIWAESLLARIHSFEWRQTGGDVLRPLYERFVKPADRRDFGEVYTPDWLAEMIVGEVLDDEWCGEAIAAATATLHNPNKVLDGTGVLDPTCGSGTFLYHAARRLLANPLLDGLNPGQRAQVVCRLIHGIDIHPVAVEFSRATLLRALPPFSETTTASIAVYQGDALMLRDTDTGTLFEPGPDETVIRSPGGRAVTIPHAFSGHQHFADMLRRTVDAAAGGDPVPPDIEHAMPDDATRAAVRTAHTALRDIIAAEGNSVWTWYITNVLGPERLARRKVDRIVANPPWVKLSNIQVPQRKRALESLAGKGSTSKEIELWVGGKQAPHFDIAQLFVRYARASFLADPKSNPAAWLTKSSALRAGSWENFRIWHKDLLAQSLDFSDIEVFGRSGANRCCVLFEMRRSSVTAGSAEEKSAKAICEGAAPTASMSWPNEVRALFNWTRPKIFSNKTAAYPPPRGVLEPQYFLPYSPVWSKSLPVGAPTPESSPPSHRPNIPGNLCALALARCPLTGLHL